VIVITSLHTLQLKDGHVFEFDEAMHDKDHILEHTFDPQSWEEAEWTKHIHFDIYIYVATPPPNYTPMYFNGLF
jgi:hypothetical protein